MNRNHEGSCHCQAVRYRCTLDLDDPPSTRCNCSSCTRSRYWKALVPAADFELVAGADALTEYTFGSGQVKHRFCRTCGVKVFGYADFDVEFKGRTLEGGFYAINVATLALTPEALAGLPVVYEDGAQDRWDREPAVTSYL